MPAKKEYEEELKIIRQKAATTAKLIEEATHFVVHVIIHVHLILN